MNSQRLHPGEATGHASLPFALVGLACLAALLPVERRAATRGVVPIIPVGGHRLPVAFVVLTSVFDAIPYFVLFITLPVYLVRVLRLSQGAAAGWLLVRPLSLRVGAAAAGRPCTRGQLCGWTVRAEQPGRAQRHIALYAIRRTAGGRDAVDINLDHSLRIPADHRPAYAARPLLRCDVDALYGARDALRSSRSGRAVYRALQHRLRDCVRVWHCRGPVAAG
eukprot:723171-Prymnesium_polylepis.1